MTIEATLGEKYAPVQKRIEMVATALNRSYNDNIPRDDLVQEMWLGLIERIDSPAFTNQSTKHIVNKLAWKARDYARKQFRYMNGLSMTDILDGNHNPKEWEYFAVALTPYDTTNDIDAQLTAIDRIDKLMLALANRPRTLSIARSLLGGMNKVETAKHIGIDPSTVTYHIRVMRKILTEMTVQ